MYCVNENLDAYSHFGFFFNFSFFLSVTLIYNTYGYFFLSFFSVKDFSATT